MNREINIPDLRRAALAALKPKGHGVSGGWSATVLKGRVYQGASFPFANEWWVVVTGPQRPAAAQLLDATACLQQLRKADHGVAMLRPEEVSRQKAHEPAGSKFRSRYQAAVWDGLGIVAVDVEGDSTPWHWRPAPPLEPGDLDDLARDVREAIKASRSGPRRRDWEDVVEHRGSRKAESFVREAVTTAIGGLFEKGHGKDLEFDAMWRHAITDGVWRRRKTGLHPQRLALEVKVTEDVGAPFCQAMDDLGNFDAVIYVRLISKRTRKELERLPGLHDLKGDVQKRLPVRFIDEQF